MSTLVKATGDWFWKICNPVNGESIGYHQKADGSMEYWRQKADRTWIKLPPWWHPATFSYQPWQPRIKHSCERNQA
jgi:hypothetical protein